MVLLKILAPHSGAPAAQPRSLEQTLPRFLKPLFSLPQSTRFSSLHTKTRRVAETRRRICIMISVQSAEFHWLRSALRGNECHRELKCEVTCVYTIVTVCLLCNCLSRGNKSPPVSLPRMVRPRRRGVCFKGQGFVGFRSLLRTLTELEPPE